MIILLLIVKILIALPLKLTYQTESPSVPDVVHTSQSWLLNIHSEASVNLSTAFSSSSRHLKLGVYTWASLC